MINQTELIQIAAGFVGTVGFALLFNICGKRLIMAALGGLLSWLLFVLVHHVIPSEPVVYFIVACAISLYAELMARLLKTPTTAFIITSLIPLSPGASLYYTMVYAFQGDLNTFIPKAVYTLELAAALALGVIVSATLVRVFHRITHKKPR